MSRHVVETLRRVFAEFLTIPSVVTGAFLLLAFAMHSIDLARPASDAFWGGLFTDVQGAREFLERREIRRINSSDHLVPLPSKGEFASPAPQAIGRSTPQVRDRVNDHDLDFGSHR